MLFATQTFFFSLPFSFLLESSQPLCAYVCVERVRVDEPRVDDIAPSVSVTRLATRAVNTAQNLCARSCLIVIVRSDEILRRVWSQTFGRGTLSISVAPIQKVECRIYYSYATYSAGSSVLRNNDTRQASSSKDGRNEDWGRDRERAFRKSALVW